MSSDLLLERNGWSDFFWTT